MSARSACWMSAAPAASEALAGSDLPEAPCPGELHLLPYALAILDDKE